MAHPTEEKATTRSDRIREELEQRRADVQRLADEVRLKIHLGGMDAKDAWQRLQPKLEDFERKAEKVGADIGKELRVLGSTLKSELQKLRDRLS